MDRGIATELVDTEERAEGVFEALSMTHYITSGGQRIEDYTFEDLKKNATVDERIDSIISMVNKLIETCTKKDRAEDFDLVDELSSPCLDDAYGVMFTSLKESDMPQTHNTKGEEKDYGSKVGGSESDSESEEGDSESDSESEEGDTESDSESEEGDTESDSESEEGDTESDSENEEDNSESEESDSKGDTQNELIKDLEFALARTYRNSDTSSVMNCTLTFLEACTSIRDEPYWHSGRAFPIIRHRMLRDFLSIIKTKRRIMKATLGNEERAKSIYEILSLVHEAIGCESVEEFKPSTNVEKVVEDVILVVALIIDKFYNAKDLNIRPINDKRRFQTAANVIITSLSPSDAYDWNFTTPPDLRSTSEQIMYSLIRAEEEELVSIVPTKTETWEQINEDIEQDSTRSEDEESASIVPKTWDQLCEGFKEKLRLWYLALARKPEQDSTRSEDATEESKT